MRTELEQGLIRDRHNPRLWAVYADWLESQGDPRGALMSLMLKREAMPSRALEEAVLAQAPLLRALTPDSLETLATRGHGRLAPVFRRGFLASAGATQASDFEALIRHPSAAFLESVILEPDDPDTLEAWFETLEGPLPWRSLELAVPLAESLDLARLAAHLPVLHTLTLELPDAPFTFPALPSLRRVRLRAPSPEQVSALVEAALPQLEVVELLAPRDDPRSAPELDPLVVALSPRLPRLSRVVLEGVPGAAVRGLKNAVVRTLDPPDRDFPHPLPLEVEVSLAVLRGPLSPERLGVLTTFARLAGVERLVVTEGTLHLGSSALSVLRLSGSGELRLVPRSAILQLAKKDRALDAVALTLSGSNDVASAWAAGPHVAPPGPTSGKVLPVARRDESAHTHRELTRAVLGAMLGFDPGLDVLEELLAAVELGVTHTLLGKPPDRGEQLALFTDHQAVPEEEDVDEYDEDEEEEEDEPWTGDDFHFDPDPWGGAPSSVPDFGPPEPAELAAPQEDDPEDDLDPPLHDAATADEEEVWGEGPIDLPEHHDALPGDPIAEPEQELLLTPNGDLPCPRCQQPAEVSRCAQCHEEVCRACAGELQAAAWDEERAFCCAQCQPLVPGLFVAPR